jgi:Flp pilus assembly protein TadD
MAQVSGKAAPVEQSQILIAGAKNAMALHAQGDLSAAEMQYAVVVPFVQHAGLYAGYASLLIDTGRAAQGEKWLRRTLALYPDHPLAVALPGATAQQAERWEEAEKWLLRRLRLGGDVAAIEAVLGVAYTRLDRIDEGVEHCRQAVRAAPLNADYRFNLAAALEKADSFAAAAKSYRAAAALRPDHLGALENGALAAARVGDASVAARLYRRLCILSPEKAEFRYWLGEARLACGDWRGGWADCEARLSAPAIAPPPPVGPPPMWRGERLQDGELLIVAEQGIGDALLFARFIPAAVDQAGRATLLAHSGLVRLLTGMWPGVAVKPLGMLRSVRAEAWVPLASLPHILTQGPGCTPRAPYLSVAREAVSAWRSRLGIGDDGRRCVGIVWAGNPAYLHDRRRSPGLKAFRPLLDVPGRRPVALQVGAGRQDLAAQPWPGDGVDAGALIKDFADTAAVIANLDLVVSSITSVLHLAAAMGVETWGVAPAHMDWRWTTGDDGRLLWYPTLRLFRQQRVGHWGETIDAVRDALSQRP